MLSMSNHEVFDPCFVFPDPRHSLSKAITTHPAVIRREHFVWAPPADQSSPLPFSHFFSTLDLLAFSRQKKIKSMEVM